MQRILDAVGYHSALGRQDLEEALAVVLVPFLCLAMLVSVGLTMALR